MIAQKLIAERKQHILSIVKRYPGITSSEIREKSELDKNTCMNTVLSMSRVGWLDHKINPSPNNNYAKTQYMYFISDSCPEITVSYVERVTTLSHLPLTRASWRNYREAV